MITQVSEFLIFLFPGVKRLLIKKWYQHLAGEYTLREWTFMNYGYADLDGEAKLVLHKNDELDRYYIQLYHHVAGITDLKGKDVLEVGSGRGGGCYYIARYLKPKKLIGMDYSQNAVDLCNRLYTLPNLRFHNGDAEAIPFPDHSFDVVLNIESSHCYKSVPKFISEVTRVLKPGGFFSWADLRWNSGTRETDKIFRKSGLHLIKEEDITSNVIRALEMVHTEKLNTIEAHAPKYMWKMMREFTGVKGTKVYNAFRSRKKVYLSKALQKI
jgi:ubiquinone/menaquinone biosynthesis C-methylase UbiE